MSDGPRSAADQRDEMAQAQSGITNSGEGFGTNSTADLGQQQNVFAGNGPAGDVAGSAAGATTGSDMAQGDQAGYGSNPQQGGMMDDADSRSAIDGQQQSEIEEDSLADEEDVESESDIDDGSSAASSAGAM